MTPDRTPPHPAPHQPLANMTGTAGVADDAQDRVALHWPALASGAGMEPGTVLVVAAVLRCDESGMANFARQLSVEEHERAGHFHRAELRRRFVVSRGVLREVLAACAGCRPEALRLQADLHGKPALVGVPTLHFNLAHSHELMLLAVSRGSELGVDVEWVRPMKDACALARRFFTPHESAWLEAQSAADRDQAFFRLWTRKEAVLKACGQGIAHGLDRLELLDCHGAWRDPVQYPEVEGRVWRITELHPAAGYLAAVAFSPEVREVRCHSRVNTR